MYIYAPIRVPALWRKECVGAAGVRVRAPARRLRGERDGDVVAAYDMCWVMVNGLYQH